MPYTWKPCDFETFNNIALKREFAALSKIGCAALNCIEVDPAEDNCAAFTKLISLFCIVSENTPAISEKLKSSGEETDQLTQTLHALTALSEFPQASIFDEVALGIRISVYADAAIKIHDGLPADGNPIVEIL